MQIVVQILENLLLLAFLGLSFYWIETTKASFSKNTVSLFHGLSFGLIAFLVTSTPLTMNDGATVDARAAPVIIAGFIAGPIGAVVAASFGALGRAIVGGGFAFSGVAVYLIYAAIGLAFWWFRPPKSEFHLNPKLVGVLAGASCIGAASMFFLIEPRTRAVAWMQDDLPYIFAMNVFGIFVASIALIFAINVLEKTRKIVEMNGTLRLAKRASKLGIWDFDILTGKLSWDERSKELHGVAKNTFHGTFEDWARNVHPDDLGYTQDTFAKAIKDGDFFDAEYRVIHSDGDQKVIKGDAILLRNSAGDATRIVGTNLDLTGIRTAQSQLREAELVAIQAQKFDTIGQLTGGVAHDFNNLLAVIMGNLELMNEEIDRDETNKTELHMLLDASLEATRRGAELTQNMLAYARKARLTPIELELNGLIRETENWMRRTIPSTVEIETNLQAGLWQVLADKSSLQSAIINLLVNARDAIEGSGKVTIETANMRIDESFIIERREDVPAGRYVMLAISDTGRGIEPDILAKVFDPFFTTKRVGEGSGLGLSMVQGFVKQSGGAVRVYSEVGVGTSFKIYLPALNAKPGAYSISPSENQDLNSDDATNRILLVEDREEVLLVLKKTLEKAGYSITTAASGDEGYEVFRRDSNFDLIVTDIVMPGELQGPSMAKKIRALKTDMKFVFLSGYASEATVHGNGLAPADTRLMKPISRLDLLSAVKKGLNS